MINFYGKFGIVYESTAIRHKNVSTKPSFLSCCWLSSNSDFSRWIFFLYLCKLLEKSGQDLLLITFYDEDVCSYSMFSGFRDRMNCHAYQQYTTTCKYNIIVQMSSIHH